MQFQHATIKLSKINNSVAPIMHRLPSKWPHLLRTFVDPCRFDFEIRRCHIAEKAKAVKLFFGGMP